MKVKQGIPAIFAALAVLGSFTVTASAQEVRTATTATTTSTTESAGTISDFGHDSIVIRGETDSAPVTYHYTKSTTYVDDSGAPVSVETVKSGLPVTVHYIKGDDGMVADRVIVHKRKVTTEAPAAVEEKKSTTTTTTTDRK